MAWRTYSPLKIIGSNPVGLGWDHFLVTHSVDANGGEITFETFTSQQSTYFFQLNLESSYTHFPMRKMLLWNVVPMMYEKSSFMYQDDKLSSEQPVKQVYDKNNPFQKAILDGNTTSLLITQQGQWGDVEIWTKQRRMNFCGWSAGFEVTYKMECILGNFLIFYEGTKYKKMYYWKFLGSELSNQLQPWITLDTHPVFPIQCLHQLWHQTKSGFNSFSIGQQSHNSINLDDLTGFQGDRTTSGWSQEARVCEWENMIAIGIWRGDILLVKVENKTISLSHRISVLPNEKLESLFIWRYHLCAEYKPSEATEKRIDLYDQLKQPWEKKSLSIMNNCVVFPWSDFICTIRRERQALVLHKCWLKNKKEDCPLALLPKDILQYTFGLVADDEEDRVQYNSF